METDAHRQLLDRHLTELLDLDLAQRGIRLQQFSANERAQLEVLLTAALDDDDFLRPGGALSAKLIDAALADDEPHLPAGTELGAYRIVREIGVGGMGRVYLGERADDLFVRQVAVKLVFADSTSTSLERLQREQRILADLVHPNIARLYDAGVTAAGAPYLVMEYVDGVSITEHCQRLALDGERRLSLLIQVCAAVEAAHQRLIIHRDIKPSNILVDTAGNVKLLDFGIARLLHREISEGESPGTPPRASALQADSELTGTLGRSRLTPHYASPEQLKHQRTTTASDVYQLGLLLWELLAGRRPDAAEMDSLRGGAAALPQPDSGVKLDLPHADFTAVLKKALAIEPEHRYATADRLREDLSLLLAGHPVSARPASSGYRLLRFVTRHKLAALISLAATILVLTLSISFVQRLATERDATRQHAEQAERARLETEQVVDFLSGLFRASDPYARTDGRAPADLSARELLDRSAERLSEALPDQPLARARLLSEVSRIYRQLGLLDRAEPLERDSLLLREANPDVRPADLASSRLALGRIDLQRGRFEAAAGRIDSALQSFQDLGDQRGLASALEAKGNLQEALDQPVAIETLSRSLRLWQQIGVVEREADLRLFLANALIRQGRSGEARAQRQAALALQEVRFGTTHPAVAAALIGIADLHKAEGRPRLAIPLLQRALAIYQSSFGDNDMRLAVAANNLGIAYSDLGDGAAARPYLERALGIYQRTRPDHPELGQIQNNLGTLAWAEGKPAEAAEHYRLAIAQLRRTLPEDHLALLQARYNLGEALLALGHTDEAEPLLSDSLDGLALKLGDDHVALSTGRMYLAQIAEKHGQLDRAEALLKRALAQRLATPGHDQAEVNAARQALADFNQRHSRSDRLVN